MALTKLISDCGATKAEWRITDGRRSKTVITQGISPYFLDTQQIGAVLETELKPALRRRSIDEIYYYGTGCANPNNVRSVKAALKKLFPEAHGPPPSGRD